MAILWDSPLTAAVARELGDRLRDARLRGHLFGWEDRELFLFFESTTLRWSLHPEEGWITFQPAIELPPRARRLSARCTGVGAPVDERVLRLHFRRGRGRVRRIQVIVELMTNQWNALLTEGEDERIRHVLWPRRAGSRSLAVGDAYRPPESSTRLGAAEPLTPEEWKRLVLTPAAGERRRWILERVAFASPVNVEALLAGFRHGTPSPAGIEEGYEVWTRLRSLDPLRPCILETTRGDQPYPIVLPHVSYRYIPTILDGFQVASRENALPVGRVESVLAELEPLLEHTRRRARAIRREMDSGADPALSRHHADLLLARLHQVRRGVSQVTLLDFDGREVTLSLDPSKAPHENARALYEEASRLERARHKLPGLLREAQASARELIELRDGLLEGRVSPREGEAVLFRHLGSAARLPGRAGKATEEERQPFRRFRSSGGLEIRVGRGPKDNDALTFHRSNPEDIWLHARGAGGAHVILRWSRTGQPPARDLTEAAVLAALHSSARGAGVVPVDWTRRKYVRKPRKAPPGAVVPDRVQTLFVEPDANLPSRLAWRP